MLGHGERGSATAQLSNEGRANRKCAPGGKSAAPSLYNDSLLTQRRRTGRLTAGSPYSLLRPIADSSWPGFLTILG